MPKLKTADASPPKHLPVVAIVGRPNVGKSSLFNRLVGFRRAVTSEIAGTTRDRVSAEVALEGLTIELVDTGGLMDHKGEVLEDDVQKQIQTAFTRADLLVFVVDVRQEANPGDFTVTDLLRKSGKPHLFVANKCDDYDAVALLKFYEYGLGEPIAVSAAHRFGIGELENRIIKTLRKKGFRQKKAATETPLKLAIVGKPNVGKSSLLNAFLKEPRAIVSDIPGTTRDAIDATFDFNGKSYTIIDTAGLRRRGKVRAGIERFSVERALSAVERSDVALLLIDAHEGIAKQDLHVSEKILSEYKGLIIVANKSDLLADEAECRKIFEKIRWRFAFAPYAPIVFVSAQNRENLAELLKTAEKIHDERAKRITTGAFNNFLSRITARHLPIHRGVRPKIFYGTQVGTHPPHFVLFVKNPDAFHFSWRRFLENELRKEFGFEGTAVRIEFKERSKRNPKGEFKRPS